MAPLTPDTLRPAIIGPFGPAQATCLTSWLRAGLKPVFVHITEGSPRRLLGAGPDSYMAIANGDFRTAPGVERVAAFLTKSGASGVATLAYETAAWLSSNRSHFANRCGFWFCEGEVLRILMTKDAQLGLARSAGLPVLDTFRIHRANHDRPPADAYPLVLRPDDPSAIRPLVKAELCRNEGALETFLAGLTHFDGPLIAQPFVSGPNIVVHGARKRDGHSIRPVAFLVERKFEGLSLTMRRTTIQPALESACLRFVELLQLVGVYHFELIVDERTGDTYFLEINGRLGGTTAKAYALGFDEPAHLIDAFAGTALGEPEIRAGCGHIAVSKLAVAKRMGQLISGQSDPLAYPQRGLLAELCSLACGMVRWREPMLSSMTPRVAAAYLGETLLRRR